MRNIEQIVDEKVGILVRAYLDSGLPLSKDECFWLANKAKDQIRAAIAECLIPVPRTILDSENDGYRTRIKDYDNRCIHGYHIVDGHRRLITQVLTLDGILYWTDGKREVNNDKKWSIRCFN